MANPQTLSVLDKLRDEMAAHPDDSMISTVGEILTIYAGDRPTVIPALVAEGKSLDGAITVMRSAAGKACKGTNSYVFDMMTGMKIVLEYYGLPEDKRGIARAALAIIDQMAEADSPALHAKKPTAGLDLDSLLAL